jgi:hypothetical protein
LILFILAHLERGYFPIGWNLSGTPTVSFGRNEATDDGANIGHFILFRNPFLVFRDLLCENKKPMAHTEPQRHKEKQKQVHVKAKKSW